MKIFNSTIKNFKTQIKNIILKSFNIDSQEIDFFLNCAPSGGRCFVCEENKEIVSSLCTFPRKFYIYGKVYTSMYIYGAATLPEYRNRGYMSQLFEYLKTYAKQKGVHSLSLVPGTQSLEKYYNKLGFINFFKTKKIILSNEDVKNLCKHIEINLDMCYNAAQIAEIRKNIYKNKNAVIYSPEEIDYTYNLFKKAYLGDTIFTPNGHVFCRQISDSSLELIDFSTYPGKQKEIFSFMFKTFPQYKNYILETCYDNDFFKNEGKTYFYGMINPLINELKKDIDTVILNENYPFMGITWD